MVNDIISAILQVLVFTLIPFIVYLIQKRSAKGFFNYIGLFKPEKNAVYLSILTALIFLMGGIGLVLLNDSIKEVMLTPPSITGKLRVLGMNGESIFILLLIAGVKTSLSEEILFRGFIAKRLVNKLGFYSGNLLQALIFSVIHGLLFWTLTKAGVTFIIFILLFSGFAGYVVGIINDKKGNGSIIPGWIAHGLGNTISYFTIAFLL